VLQSDGNSTDATGAVRLSIIIVTWNIKDVLRPCLESLFRDNLEVACEVILVDNGSIDGTVEMLESDFPQVQVLRNAENLGFPKANNQGIERARGDYILLLNSDTIITDPGIFPVWIDFMDSHPEAGFSGCRLVFADESHQVGDAGYRPGLWTVFSHNFFLNRLFPGAVKGLLVSYRKSPGVLAVDWVCGADLMIRKSILPEVGLLDENIFIYAEDVEWGCRARTFGYRGYYLPDLEIVHLQGATTGKYPDQFSGMDLKNMRRIFKALNPGQPLLIYDLLMVAGFILRSVLYALMFWQPRDFRRRRASRMFKYLKFSLANIGKV